MMDLVRARNRLATATKTGGDVEAARRDLDAAHIARAIREHGERLTAEQRAELATMLVVGEVAA